jgi:3-oxoadipate enol-lactonase
MSITSVSTRYTTTQGTTLAYEVQGQGEPVLLLHPGFVARAFSPVYADPELENYRLIHYDRPGYGSSSPVSDPIPFEKQAEYAAAILDAVDVPKAHVVGHSLGALVALQMAVSMPERVHSLALLEPPLVFAMRENDMQSMMAVMGQAFTQFGSGNLPGAVDAWLDGAFGPGWQTVVEQSIPGALAQTYKDGTAAFVAEAPALQTWDFGLEQIKQITQPVLAAFHMDEHLPGVFQDPAELISRVLPQTELVVIPNATHLLQIQNPRSVATALAGFFARHPFQDG